VVRGKKFLNKERLNRSINSKGTKRSEMGLRIQKSLKPQSFRGGRFEKKADAGKISIIASWI
jgi:hypothetical protein